MRDMTNNVLVKRAISPASVSDNTAQVSQIIDRQGFDAVTFVILIGSVADADATFVTLLEEGDASNLSDAVAVADTDMVSQTSGTAPETAASFQFDDDNEVRKLGYIGNKRYLRLTVTPAGNASAAVLAAAALLSKATMSPITQSAS